MRLKSRHLSEKRTTISDILLRNASRLKRLKELEELETIVLNAEYLYSDIVTEEKLGDWIRDRVALVC